MDPVVVSAVAQPGQISLWHLIMQASWPVFLVMVGLGPGLGLVLGGHHREVFRGAPDEFGQ